jgi:hypothetical protein
MDNKRESDTMYTKMIAVCTVLICASNMCMEGTLETEIMVHTENYEINVLIPRHFFTPDFSVQKEIFISPEIKLSNKNLGNYLGKIFDFFTYNNSNELAVLPNLDTYLSGKKVDVVENIIQILNGVGIKAEVLDEIKRMRNNDLIRVKFPDDKHDSTSEYFFLKKYIPCSRVIQDMSDDLKVAAPISLPNIQYASLRDILTLLGYCFLPGTFPEQLYYEQRKSIHEFLRGPIFSISNHVTSSFHDLVFTIHHLGINPVLCSIVDKEYVRQIKKQKQFDISRETEEQLKDAVHGAGYETSLRRWFIDPILTCLKALAPINLELLDGGDRDFSVDEKMDSGSGETFHAPNAPIVAVVKTDNLYFINLASGTSTAVQLKGAGNPSEIVGTFSHDNTMVALMGRDAIILYSETQKMLHTINPNEAATCCTFGPRDKELIVGFQDGSIAIYNTETAAIIASATYASEPITSIACHPDDSSTIVFTAGTGAWVVFSGIQRNPTKIYSFENRKELISTANIRDASIKRTLAVTFTPDGEFIICVALTTDGKIVFYKFTTDEFFLQEEIESVIMEGGFGPAFRKISPPPEPQTPSLQEKTLQTADIIHQDIEIIKTNMFINQYLSTISFQFFDKAVMFFSSIENEIHFYEPAMPFANSPLVCGLLLGHSRLWLKKFTLIIQSALTKKSASKVYSTTEKKQYLNFVAFSQDGNSLYIRHLHDKIGTVSLYQAHWIEFFKYMQATKFSLKELHTLYRNFLSVKNKTDLQQFMNMLPTGMSDEFTKRIAMCFNKEQEKTENRPVAQDKSEKNVGTATIQPESIKPNNIEVTAEKPTTTKKDISEKEVPPSKNIVARMWSLLYRRSQKIPVAFQDESLHVEQAPQPLNVVGAEGAGLRTEQSTPSQSIIAFAWHWVAKTVRSVWSSLWGLLGK